jgi:hypothetical protein
VTTEELGPTERAEQVRSPAELIAVLEGLPAGDWAITSGVDHNETGYLFISPGKATYGVTVIIDTGRDG